MQKRLKLILNTSLGTNYVEQRIQILFGKKYLTYELNQYQSGHLFNIFSKAVENYSAIF